MMKRLTAVVDAAGVVAVAVLSSSGVASAAPSGFANFGNAQDTVNALTAAGYNVQINGAAAFPLPSCEVTQTRRCSRFAGASPIPLCAAVAC